nr:AraC family transcriptional regulator [Burkholderia sp. Ax-1719]
MPGLFLVREPGPTLPCQVVVEPVFSLIVQGAKRVEIGKQAFSYRAGQCLVVSVDLPANAYVVEATPEQPYLGLGLMLRPEAIAGLLLESGNPRTVGEGRSGIAIGELSSDLADPVVRLLRLLDRPSDVPILATSLEREILWRLINGPQGAMVRQIGLADSRMSQIGRAVRWLRGHFAEAVRIEDLAGIAGMSVTSFHRHFRNVTSMTPIQYQKQIRLQAARTRLMTTCEDVSAVGFAVGYESPSQFSREYRRMFGKPPGQDGTDLRRDPSATDVPVRVV